MKLIRISLLIMLCAVFFVSIEGYAEEAEFCLGCHGYDNMSKSFLNGEELSLYVDMGEIQKSAHNMLDCSNSHYGYSVEDHPERSYRNKRSYSIISAKACQGCHNQFKEIHRGMINENILSVVCTDCHGSHNIKPIKEFYSGTEYCLGCHHEALEFELEDGDKVSAWIKAGDLKESAHHRLNCTDCHHGFSSQEHPIRHFKSKRNLTIILSEESCRRCHFDKYTRTLESIHYSMLVKGRTDAPVCVDCHGAHSIFSGRFEKALNAKRCEKCHSAIYSVYKESVHGAALISENNQDVPICSDCHRAHDTQDPRTPEFRLRIPDMCGNCHSNEHMMKPYGLSTEVVETYIQDFHGVTLGFYIKQGAQRSIATCTDCHGIHDIEKSSGLNSLAVKAKLVKRCQQCHPDATENFPASWISHYEADFAKAPVVYLINLIYKIFIPFMMIGLILQILLHSITLCRRSIRGEGLEKNQEVLRLGPLRIMEHRLNIVVFIVLVVTGLSQKFHDAAFSQWVIMSFGGIDATRLIHRISGVGLTILTLLHFLVAFYGVLFRRWYPSMVIHKKDFLDAIDNLRYYFRLSDYRPEHSGRYDYKQKFEYWGVVVGGMIMIVTGLSLWFPTVVTRFLPGEVIPIAKALHTNEAMLAFLVIVIWHTYNAVFRDSEL
jgi:cytochrome b subunit of formate dehydrogenase